MGTKQASRRANLVIGARRELESFPLVQRHEGSRRIARPQVAGKRGLKSIQSPARPVARALNRQAAPCGASFKPFGWQRLAVYRDRLASLEDGLRIARRPCPCPFARIPALLISALALPNSRPVCTAQFAMLAQSASQSAPCLFAPFPVRRLVRTQGRERIPVLPTLFRFGSTV